MGEGKKDALRVNFNKELKLELGGVRVTSDTCLLAYREIDSAFGLTDMVACELGDNRTGKNTRHSIAALVRQSVYRCLVGMRTPMTLSSYALTPPRVTLSGNGHKIERRLPSARWDALNRDSHTGTKPEGPDEPAAQWVDEIHSRKPGKEISVGSKERLIFKIDLQ